MTGRLNIHIGYPRTGTTSLQVALCKFGDFLKEKDIFLPPSIGNRNRHLQVLGDIDANANVRRTLGIGDPPNVEAFLDKWIDGVAAASKRFPLTVMSEETVALRGKESLVRMKEKLDKYYSDINILVCFRQHESYLKSNHQQMIRATFRNKPLKDYINTLSSKPHMNYVETMQTLIDVFGKESVWAFVYTTGQDQSSNRQILAAISDGVLQDIAISGEMNQSRHINPNTLEFKRLTNAAIERALADMTYAPTGRTHARILDAIEQIFESCAKTPPDNTSPNPEQIDEEYLRKWQRDWAELTSEKYATNFG